MPCKPAPEIPVVVVLLFRLVRRVHEIQRDGRVGSPYSAFGLFGSIKALQWGAGTMLEICKFVHATTTREKENMSGLGMEATVKKNHSLVILEERLPLELFKGKSPADWDVQQLKYESHEWSLLSSYSQKEKRNIERTP
jgi:hypothetical protein